MRSRIDAADLVDAVQGFLREVEAELGGRRGFHAKVAANALAIVGRELRDEPAAAEIAALSALLPGTPPGDVVGEACRKIAAGDWSAATPGLLDALETGIIARLAVDNPKFSTLARLRERG